MCENTLHLLDKSLAAKTQTVNHLSLVELSCRGENVPYFGDLFTELSEPAAKEYQIISKPTILLKHKGHILLILDISWLKRITSNCLTLLPAANQIAFCHLETISEKSGLCFPSLCTYHFQAKEYYTAY